MYYNVYFFAHPPRHFFMRCADVDTGPLFCRFKSRISKNLNRISKKSKPGVLLEFVCNSCVVHQPRILKNFEQKNDVFGHHPFARESTFL